MTIFNKIQNNQKILNNHPIRKGGQGQESEHLEISSYLTIINTPILKESVSQFRDRLRSVSCIFNCTF